MGAKRTKKGGSNLLFFDILCNMESGCNAPVNGLSGI